MSNSTNSILLQEKLEILRLQHLEDSSTQISEKMGRSIDSVERILSQKGHTKKCRSPKRSRNYLNLGDRLRVICDLSVETNMTKFALILIFQCVLFKV